jgi:ABC-type phosphate transport system substrate-binding protein
MRKIVIALLMFVSLLGMRAALADPVAVIVNSANTQQLSVEDVRNIYSDRTIAWAAGGRIAVYNLPADDDAAEIFARKVLGVSARDAAAAESNRVVSNVARNTQQMKRDVLVSAIVARTPYAIGYVPKSQAAGKSSIRILFTLE